MELTNICGRSEGQKLALSDGSLYKNDGGKWEPFDFNGLHDGYYPACEFTALACEDGLFYAAGVDSQGVPHLFTSLLGGVWERQNLTMRQTDGGAVRASGRIIRILWSDTLRQVFLVCSNGLLVTLPDCPDCVRISRVGDGEVVGGEIIGDSIVFRFADGKSKSVSLSEAAQFRVSFDYAKKLQKQGALIIDLRSPIEHSQNGLPNSVNVAIETLTQWLDGRGRGETIIFVCSRGIKSDIAVQEARRLGFSHSFTLGGMN